MKAKILRDTTIDGLAEKINREFENSKAPFLQQVCTQYKTAVVPKMRGKEIVGHEVEYSALIFIEEVGETKKPEKEAMRQQESWIYRPLRTDPDVERKLEAVEKALGFKLFIWQKTFIERGVFRQYGETTARILKDLLDTKAQPLDYAEPCGSVRENFYRMETRNIKEKLDNAGIATRVVFFTKEEKVAYMKMKN